MVAMGTLVGSISRCGMGIAVVGVVAQAGSNTTERTSSGRTYSSQKRCRTTTETLHGFYSERFADA